MESAEHKKFIVNKWEVQRAEKQEVSSVFC